MNMSEENKSHSIERIGMQAFMSDMVRRTLELKKSMAQISAVPERKIPIQILKDNFLAWFAGIDQDIDGVLYKYWITIAGSPFERVTVLDEDGSVFALVPPLRDRSIVNIRTTRGEGATDSMVQQAAQLSSLNTNLAHTTLANKLANKYMTETNPPSLTALIEEWVAFMDLFGINIRKNKASSVVEAEESDFED